MQSWDNRFLVIGGHYQFQYLRCGLLPSETSGLYVYGLIKFFYYFL